MTPDSHTDFWQALYTAYEHHAPEEARRLLSSLPTAPECSALLRCGDEEYIQWLLQHQLLSLPEETTSWPELQERLLQCDAIREEYRPQCITEGTWPPPPETPADT